MDFILMALGFGVVLIITRTAAVLCCVHLMNDMRQNFVRLEWIHYCIHFNLLRHCTRIPQEAEEQDPP